eukprot:10021270-Prorocentrum_lima.AAC.1
MGTPEQRLAALEQALAAQQHLSAQLQQQFQTTQAQQRAPAPTAAVSAMVIGKPDCFNGPSGSWRD